jgi:hypothetical protein
MISVLVELNEHNRQQLGSMEIDGTMFYGPGGNEYSMGVNIFKFRD